MAVGDIKYSNAVFVQEFEVDGSVSKGDLLQQDTDGDFSAIGDSSDPTTIDGVALEDGDDTDVIKVLLSGLVEVVDADSVFDTGDWDDVTNVIEISQYPYDLETGNIVIYLK